MEIINALEIEHSDDFTKGVQPMPKYLLGVYRIDSNDYTRYIDKTITVRGVTLKLTPRYKMQEKSPRSNDEREGTYVTIFNAYQGPNRSIKNEAFDRYFEEKYDIEILIQTQLQRRKNTHSVTNHRWLVVKSNSEENVQLDIGSQVTVDGRILNLMYDGM